MKHSYIGLGAFAGLWAGAMVAGVGVIAFNTGFESQTIVGGHRLRDIAIVLILVAGAAVGTVVGAGLGAKYSPHGL